MFTLADLLTVVGLILDAAGAILLIQYSPIRTGHKEPG